MTSIKYFILGNFLLFGFIAFPLSIFSAPIIQGPVVPAMYWKTSGGGNIFYTGGNIGIGKNNPTYLLDINGIINFIGFRMTTGASNNYILASDASGNARWTSTGSLFSSYVETDPLISAWAKAPTKPAYNFTEITGTVTDAQVPDTVTINNASTATALQTARTIGGVSFNGTANINLPGVNTAGNQNTTGNAATATALQTSRTINGIAFNGTADITLPTVNTTGDQTISGNKTFNNDITVVGKVITDTLVNRTVAQLTVSGSIFPNATSSQKDLGATGNRWANLWLSGNANVTGSVTAGSFVGPLTGNASTATNASTVTNGVYTSSSYADPAWITSLAKSKVGLANVDNTSDANKPVSTLQQTALNLKADLASPALSGTPTAPTAAVATNTTQIATTAFVNSKVATLLDYQSSRDFPLGTLIQSDIDYSVTNGEPFLLEIQGNAYGSIVPFDIKYQGYIYSDTVINHGGISVGTNITGLVLFNYGGKLCFWFPSQSYWHGYTVNINDSYAGTKKNRLVSITNAAKPGAITKEVALSANIRQGLHSSNFNSYAPTLTGVGASGTWGINITGNAENVTTPTGGYKHLGAWGVGRTAVGAILVNTAYMADSATTAGTANAVSFNGGLTTTSGPTFGSLSFYGVGGNSGQPAATSDYRIYQAPGPWAYPYPDLNIAWHTGISIGAHTSYGGIRFYNNSDMVTETMSIGNGDGNVRIANNLFVNGVVTGATPIAANHLATKAYVDAAVGAAGGHVQGGSYGSKCSIYLESLGSPQYCSYTYGAAGHAQIYIGPNGTSLFSSTNTPTYPMTSCSVTNNTVPVGCYYWMTPAWNITCASGFTPHLIPGDMLIGGNGVYSFQCMKD